MRYIIVFLTIFITFFDISSSNLCWYFSNNSQPRLERRKIAHHPACSCECWKYPHTKGTNNQYKCSNCEHRITPPDPLSKNGPQFIRHNESQEETDLDKQLFMDFNQVPAPTSKALQNPLNQQPRETSYTADPQRWGFLNRSN